MTNYERIKEMTVEEMAEAIETLQDLRIECFMCLANDIYGKLCDNFTTCVDGIKAWLESEVKE
ncbi:MAG: hypothetical protein IKV80_08410 [Bacteroidales bacterium]|nr:hypothetical protein [Bacteroidales bacterium]